MKWLVSLIFWFASFAFASPVTIVTTSGAGSLSDQVARYIQPILEKELNKDVVVVNVPGANGLLGLRAFNNLEGEHVLIGSFAVPFNAKTNPQKDFDPIKDFSPIVGLTHSAMHILVPTSSNINTVSELIALAKSRKELKGGSSHASANISMLLLDKQYNINTLQVNYKQGAQLYADLSSGLLDYTFGGATSTALALIKSGHLKSLGRLDQLGIPDFSWTAAFVKTEHNKGAVAAALRKVINAESMSGLQQPYFKANEKMISDMVNKEHSLIPAAFISN